MTKCSVPRCRAAKSTTRRRARTQSQFVKWIDLLKSKVSHTRKDNLRVCDDHFRPEDFETSKKLGCSKKWLCHDAVPSVNLPSIPKNVDCPINNTECPDVDHSYFQKNVPEMSILPENSLSMALTPFFIDRVKINVWILYL